MLFAPQRFRGMASVLRRQGLPSPSVFSFHIYAFHCSRGIHLHLTPLLPTVHICVHGLAGGFHMLSYQPPAHPLASKFRLNVAPKFCGWLHELAGAYFLEYRQASYYSISSFLPVLTKVVYNRAVNHTRGIAGSGLRPLSKSPLLPRRSLGVSVAELWLVVSASLLIGCLW